MAMNHEHVRVLIGADIAIVLSSLDIAIRTRHPRTHAVGQAVGTAAADENISKPH